MIGYTALGLKLRIGQYHLRIWKNGFEYGNRLGGKVKWFPWFNPSVARKEFTLKYEIGFCENCESSDVWCDYHTKKMRRLGLEAQ